MLNSEILNTNEPSSPRPNILQADRHQDRSHMLISPFQPPDHRIMLDRLRIPPPEQRSPGPVVRQSWVQEANVPALISSSCPGPQTCSSLRFPSSIFALAQLHRCLISLETRRTQRRESFTPVINSLRTKLAQIDAYLCNVVGDRQLSSAEKQNLHQVCDLEGGDIASRSVMTRVAVEREATELERKLMEGEKELEGRIEEVRGRLGNLEAWIEWALEGDDDGEGVQGGGWKGSLEHIV